MKSHNKKVLPFKSHEPKLSSKERMDKRCEDILQIMFNGKYNPTLAQVDAAFVMLKGDTALAEVADSSFKDFLRLSPDIKCSRLFEAISDAPASDLDMLMLVFHLRQRERKGVSHAK